MKEKSSKKGVMIGAAVLIVAVAAAALIYAFLGPKAQAGSKNVTIEVINSAGEQKSYSVVTDAQYLKEAMDDAEGLTYTVDSGNMVISVNGETADYAADHAYWAFYVQGEYCSYGITQQPVADGDVFTIEYCRE